MKVFQLPFGGGAVISPNDDDAERIINKRAKFSLQYMKEKGWGDDVTALSIKQILEIREQPGWKKPV